MIDILCGPADDIRRFRFELPEESLKLGVLVSGGIDSALLYYLLLKLNSECGNRHEIIPYSVMRREGSRTFAEPVISYISGLFGKKMPLTVVGNNELPEDKQVKSGVYEALIRHRVDIVYVGVIEQLPAHMVGWSPIPASESSRFKMPFVHLNKSHIIDLVYQVGQEHLLDITHSCIFDTGRCVTCNGCREREWAFTLLGKKDTGKV